MDRAAFETYIVDTCTNHELVHQKDENYRACVSIGTDYFVKYGDPETLGPEFETQSYLFEYAKSDPDAPRIPKAIHYFGDQTTMYLVMEFIRLTPSPPDLVERTAQAVKWLSGVPPPPGHVVGPLGGGHIRHKFFKDFMAPLPFRSVAALERYIQKAYTTLLSPQRQERVAPVRICDDRPMFTQSDMDPSNFGVDEHGNTTLMNFGAIGLLPESFAAHTMSTRDKRLAPIASYLGLSRSANASMAAISSHLWMTSDETLGLDEYGNPKTGGRNRKMEWRGCDVCALSVSKLTLA
ncbi:hypothetical protein EDD16DRAFT_637009 [Pisolithus croceorrhizus]|nr:hypothetical protein EDD16DRAFT_637009 [Pisolithus croceorrhizus]KAI6108489.1 hypothetical protein EV401DRAFT_2000801 [Pisolithus croceorrhizus]KAI6156193.1 hypothetical protein EDD17DRAFT_1627919 [Pisolithus thermaeus]